MASMKPSGLVKELRIFLLKSRQFMSKITNFRVCTFWMSGKIEDSCRRPTQQAILVSFHPFLTHSHLITAPRAEKYKKT